MASGRFTGDGPMAGLATERGVPTGKREGCLTVVEYDRCVKRHGCGITWPN